MSNKITRKAFEKKRSLRLISDSGKNGFLNFIAPSEHHVFAVLQR